MYINPFVVGVFVTVFFGLIAMIAWGAHLNKKEKQNKK